MARRRWVWDRCIECRRRLVVYYRWITVCPLCYAAWSRIDDEARAVPGELRYQRVINLRAAKFPGHPVRSSA
jgi:hypothetical protein